MNSTLARVADVNGTTTLVINGTLPNGTTASGGTVNANAAPGTYAELRGWWMMLVVVGCTVLYI